MKPLKNVKPFFACQAINKQPAQTPRKLEAFRPWAGVCQPLLSEVFLVQVLSAGIIALGLRSKLLISYQKYLQIFRPEEDLNIIVQLPPFYNWDCLAEPSAF